MSNEEVRVATTKTLADIAIAVRESGKPLPATDKSAVEATMIAFVANLTDDKETIRAIWATIKIALLLL